ncbi:peptidyl-prolyl cis-trans isomerase [Qipengyuania nanhaisediminis]
MVAASMALALPLSAQEAEAPPPSPNQIVESAAADEWIAIPAEDLLVMTLAPAADGSDRQVVIQLMSAPFSQGWTQNIRTLARARWYDGITVNRVQDNYVVQWGDPGHDNPESGETETKPLPEGLNVMEESDYTFAHAARTDLDTALPALLRRFPALLEERTELGQMTAEQFAERVRGGLNGDPYAEHTRNLSGWPVGISYAEGLAWPVHCYGMVGVGRSYSPDTGSGAELYTVIGHAPRHLDRNIALVGRIISGMEHLSSLPRGSGALGFYTEDEADLRTPIASIRVAADLPQDERPAFEYLTTEGETFARYAEARANRRDPFFIVPAGGADICNIPVPVREADGE